MFFKPIKIKFFHFYPLSLADQAVLYKSLQDPILILRAITAPSGHQIVSIRLLVICLKEPMLSVTTTFEESEFISLRMVLQWLK